MAEGLAPWMRGRDRAPLKVVPLHTTRQGPGERNRSQEESFLQRPVSARYCQSPALCSVYRKMLTHSSPLLQSVLEDECGAERWHSG